MGELNRRSFLKWLGGTAAGAAAAHVLDLDKLLWIPGEKTILIPAVEIYRPVTLTWSTGSGRTWKRVVNMVVPNYPTEFRTAANVG